MPTIESYSFGRMTVDGKTYTKDIIIFPDNSILSPWWRRAGHRLERSDIGKLVAMSPDIIIAGTGASGLMKIDGGLVSFLEEQQIAFIALPTAEAVRVYNERVRKEVAGGCFHLTC